MSTVTANSPATNSNETDTKLKLLLEVVLCNEELLPIFSLKLC